MATATKTKSSTNGSSEKSGDKSIPYCTAADCLETIKFEITGRTPLIMTNPIEMFATRMQTAAEKKRKKVEPTPFEEALDKAYFLNPEEGNYRLYFPAMAIRAAICAAAEGRKDGKVFLGKIFPQTLFCLSEDVYLRSPDTKEWLIGVVPDNDEIKVASIKSARETRNVDLDVQGVWKGKALRTNDFGIGLHKCVNKTTRGGIVICRPMVMRWQFEIEFEFDNSKLTKQMIMDVIGIAGRQVGIGAFRPYVIGSPGKGGPYGRFDAKFVC